MFDFFSIGDTTLDTFLKIESDYADLLTSKNGRQTKMCFNYGDKLPVKEIHDCVAGNSANAAVSASRLGLNSAIYTILGDDDVGHRALHKFEKEKVATDFVKLDKINRSNASFVLNYGLDRTILIYHEKRDYIFPKNVNSKAFYLTSMNHGWTTVIDDLVSNIKHNNSILFYQPGTFQLRSGARNSGKILSLTDTIFMNKEEAMEYLNKRKFISMKDLLYKLNILGPQTAVITDAQNGAYCYNENKYYYLGIDKSVKVKEKTGAGDAFSVGFATAKMLGKPIQECLSWGAVNSESVITSIGPQAGLVRRGFIGEMVRERERKIKAKEI
ncbi:MAG: putative Ribokinase [Candidatus Berkelbacteria bacterium Licking1014_85]|uniref:Putative Ribokinase n=1 Tax=Candidatus Berkelbacteria bacterium Licking1014_85 TaxID=2017148 RepID=A0A554LMU3_9BACT|nr:MAG: putative Ribokinase [Candidatus Berkelbacteria bacterium Licking1014_85]